MLSRRLSLFAIVFAALVLSACAPAATPTAAHVSGPGSTVAPAATMAPAPSGPAGQLPAASQMIIKAAQLQLLVSDSRPILDRITQLAADVGGYVLNTATSDNGGQQSATAEIAVPAAQFEPVMNQLRDQGLKVLQESTSGQDVSAEYTDLQARLDNLEATAARVRSFLAASTTVSDSLAVNTQLSDLEGQIEQIKGQMKYDEGRAAFSTISITLTPFVPEPPPVAVRAPVWNPLATFARALVALGGILRASTDAVIWFVVLTSPITLIVTAFSLGRRRLRRSSARPR